MCQQHEDGPEHTQPNLYLHLFKHHFVDILFFHQDAVEKLQDKDSEMGTSVSRKKESLFYAIASR